MRKTVYRLARRSRRILGQLRRPWRRLLRPLIAAPRAAADPLEPSPGVAAFLAGETIRQVAYYVGSADPGIISPQEDWPGALADTHGVIRDHIRRQAGRAAQLERELRAARAGGAGGRIGRAAATELVFRTSERMGWMKPRIDVESVAEWARQVLAQGKPADDGCDVDLTDAQLQEYNLAHAITVDGIFQDRDQAAADRPWWKVWSQ